MQVDQYQPMHNVLDVLKPVPNEHIVEREREKKILQ